MPTRTDCDASAEPPGLPAHPVRVTAKRRSPGKPRKDRTLACPSFPRFRLEEPSVHLGTFRARALVPLKCGHPPSQGCGPSACLELHVPPPPASAASGGGLGRALPSCPRFPGRVQSCPCRDQRPDSWGPHHPLAFEISSGPPFSSSAAVSAGAGAACVASRGERVLACRPPGCPERSKGL